MLSSVIATIAVVGGAVAVVTAASAGRGPALIPVRVRRRKTR
jgi:hypothetical protein